VEFGLLSLKLSQFLKTNLRTGGVAQAAEHKVLSSNPRPTESNNNEKLACIWLREKRKKERKIDR
jgi:hypothetical protein